MKANKNSQKSFPRRLIWAVLNTAVFALIPFAAVAQDPIVPTLSMEFSGSQAAPEKVAVTLEIIFLLTVLSVAPAIVLTATCFTRLIIVFSFIRHAMGTQQMPPNQVLAALAIFLTVAIMSPVGSKINDTALQPYLNEEIDFKMALANAEDPLREFLFKHTREKDLSVFYSITGKDRPETKEDVPTMLLLPAFVISELKTAFQIGFMIYIPFLILDMVVASILLSMGMMMLPPVMISMPFKVLLFVMVDGWNLLIGSLVNSFA